MSVINELLLALVPYTKQNLTLTYMPGLFFAKLGRITGSSRKSLSTSMWRARRLGLIEYIDGKPQLTKLGKARIEQTNRASLENGALLLVSFDIPEGRRLDRARLRSYLKKCGFLQLQASLWVSNKDYQSDIQDFVTELKLDDYICILLASSVFARGLNKLSTQSK